MRKSTRTIDEKPRGVSTEIKVLVLASFCVMLGVGVMTPAIPQFATSFGVSVAAATAVVSGFALVRLVCAPLGAWFVQWRGERMTYVTGLLITAVSSGACAAAQSYGQFVVFRSLGGVGSVMFTVSAFGLVLRLAPADQRARISGIYATSTFLGTVAGPLVGASVIGLSLRAPFFTYALVLAVVAILAWLTLRQPDDLLDSDDPGKIQKMSFREGWSAPRFCALMWSSFTTGWVVFGTRASLLPLFITVGLHESVVVASVALAVFAVSTAATLIVAGRLSDRHGRRTAIVSGSAVCCVGIGIIGLTQSAAVVMLASAVAGIGSGLITPAQQGALGDIIASRGRGGPVLAAFQAAGDLGTFVGAIASGVIAQLWGYASAFGVAAGLLLLSALYWLLPARSGR